MDRQAIIEHLSPQGTPPIYTRTERMCGYLTAASWKMKSYRLYLPVR